MAKVPTTYAVGGKFQSKDGTDLIQFVNKQGQVVLWIDCDGVLFISTTADQQGTPVVQQIGLPNDQ